MDWKLLLALVAAVMNGLGTVLMLGALLTGRRNGPLERSGIFALVIGMTAFAIMKFVL